jgi:hypothetical protein
MPRQLQQGYRLALVQVIQDAGLVRAQNPARPGIADMPRVAGKEDPRIQLQQLPCRIVDHERCEV